MSAEQSQVGHNPDAVQSTEAETGVGRGSPGNGEGVPADCRGTVSQTAQATISKQPVVLVLESAEDMWEY